MSIKAVGEFVIRVRAAVALQPEDSVDRSREFAKDVMRSEVGDAILADARFLACSVEAIEVKSLTVEFEETAEP